jgi:hypothetical protein
MVEKQDEQDQDEPTTPKTDVHQFAYLASLGRYIKYYK